MPRGKCIALCIAAGSSAGRFFFLLINYFILERLSKYKPAMDICDFNVLQIVNTLSELDGTVHIT